MKRSVDPSTPQDPADAAAAWVLRLGAGRPNATLCAAWRRWLDSDPRCRPAFARALEIWQVIGDVAAAPWLADLAGEARADVRRRRVHGREGHVRGWMLAAACLLLALIAGGAGWWYVVAPTTYATGIGERRTVQLEDGSRISLDADTRVQVAYSRDHRRLRLLRGRIACDVAKNPLRPFSVRAADKVVVATGTEFSVELLSDRVRVVLYEGHVVVLDASDDAPSPRPVRLQGTESAADASLTPGRELVVPVHRDAAQVKPISPTQSLSWEQGLLYFDNEPLASAIQRVNRYARPRLKVGDANAANTRISGVFVAGDTDAFVSGVTTVFPIRVVTRDGVRILESRSR